MSSSVNWSPREQKLRLLRFVSVWLWRWRFQNSSWRRSTFFFLELNLTEHWTRKPACPMERRPRNFTDWLRKESYLSVSPKRGVIVVKKTVSKWPIAPQGQRAGHSRHFSVDLRTPFWIFFIRNRWPKSPAARILHPWSAEGGGGDLAPFSQEILKLSTNTLWNTKARTFLDQLLARLRIMRKRNLVWISAPLTFHVDILLVGLNAWQA